MGTSVSIFANQIIAGANGNADKGNAFVFTNNGSSWSQTTELVADSSKVDDGFGQSVSIENNYIIVGAIGVDSGRGSAYIFEKNGAN